MAVVDDDPALARYAAMVTQDIKAAMTSGGAQVVSTDTDAAITPSHLIPVNRSRVNRCNEHSSARIGRRSRVRQTS